MGRQQADAERRQLQDALRLEREPEGLGTALLELQQRWC